jgi:hypothetical protein
MMIDLGESQVFKGEMAQALDGVVGGEALFPDLVEQLAQGFGIHVDLGGLLCNLTWE